MSYTPVFVTVTVYTSCSVPFVTLTVSILAPEDQEAEEPLGTEVVPFLISISAFASSGVAVTVLVALLVVAV